MGSDGDKPRKRRRPLPKVPKYEEPNEIPLAGLGGGIGGGGNQGFGRFGHGSEHHAVQPGRAGRILLWALGLRRRRPEQR